MYCAACAEETASDPCTHCRSPALLEGRYRLEHLLGRGASGITWAATRLEDGELVAIKAVPLPPGLNAKDRRLVAREVEVLQQVRHPGIPRLIEAFQVRGGAGMRIQYQVQEFVPGQTLAEVLADHRFDEDEVLAVLEEVLPVLVYLHGLSPPIVHRDLKPSNLMRRTDGSLVVIDFGAVKDALSDPQLGGSTVAGTFGYMAPEQFRGEASPRSDLYALGVTAVALLSRKAPHTLLDHSGRVQWQDHVSVSADTEALLTELLAARPEERPSSAEATLARVRQVRSRDSGPAEVSLPPMLSPTPPSVPPPVTEAPTESPSANPAAFVAMAVAVFAVGAGVAGFLVASEPAPSTHGEAARPVVVEAIDPGSRCGAEPCVPIADFSLRELRLGQTVEQAQAAFPELVDGVEGRRDIRLGRFENPGDLQAMMDLQDDQELPGPIWRVRTLIDGHLASCDLHFSVETTLSRVRCSVDDPGSDEALRDLGQQIAAELGARHGPVSPTEDDAEPMLGGWGLQWSWTDSTGRLSVRVGQPPIMGVRSGVIEVVTAAHDRELVLAKQRAELAEQARRQQRQSDEAAARDQERQDLLETIGSATEGL